MKKEFYLGRFFGTYAHFNIIGLLVSFTISGAAYVYVALLDAHKLNLTDILVGATTLPAMLLIISFATALSLDLDDVTKQLEKSHLTTSSVFGKIILLAFLPLAITDSLAPVWFRKSEPSWVDKHS